ncbi:MAG TPA: class I SAM-dependent methyltransferase [Bacteroidia bacterium]
MSINVTKDYIQWDVESWSNLLPYWEHCVDWTKVQTALELGGRQGGLSLWLAKHGLDVVCSDLNDVEQSASPLHSKHTFNGTIRYQDIDATNIPYENHFDIIIFKSILGGVGNNDQYELQKKAFAEIHKALKPGGILLFAENLYASPLHNFMRKKFVKWGAYWRYITNSELKECLTPFSSYEIKTTGFLATFGRSEKQRYFLARADKLLFNSISPNSWKYIGYGYARK